MAKIYEYLITSADDAAVADTSGNGWHLTRSGGTLATAARGYRYSTGSQNSNTNRLHRALTAGEATAINGKTGFTLIFSVDAITGSDAYLMRLASAGTEFFCVQQTASVGAWFKINDALRNFYITGSGLLAIRVDTTQAATEDRVRIGRRGYGGADDFGNAAVTDGTIPQNYTLNITDPANTYLTVMNNYTGNANVAGTVGAFIMVDEPLSDAAISAIFDALEESDDVSPIAGPAAPVLSDPSVTDLQPTTATANITTDIGSGTLYALYSTNATELAAAIKGGVSQAVSATGAQAVPLTGLPLGEAGYVHFIQTADGQDSNIVSYGFTTASKMTQSTTATVALPAGYNMVELSGELYTRGLTQLQRTPQVGWQMIGQTSEIEWAADGSAQVKKIDAPFNVWIADEFGKLSRIVYDATGLSAAVFPAAPTFSNVSGAEPSATGSQSFVLSVPDNPAETINIQGIGVGATVRNGAGAAASSVTGVHGDTIHIDWVASDEFNTPETFGVEMTGGVSAYFTVTTRAPVAPTITSQPSSQNVTAGQNATFILSATNAASYQWYEETGATDLLISGATSSSYVRSTVLGDNGKQFYCRVTSSEGGITNSSTVTLTVQVPNVTLTSEPLRDAVTKQLRANVSNIPVRIRKSDGSLSFEGTVTTDSNGVFTITNNTMASAGETVSIEFPDIATGTYSGFTYTFSGG